MSIFELTEKTTDELYKKALTRLNAYPRLRGIYDQEFLAKLARRRNYQNFLLWLLAEENQDTSTILDKIDSDLNLVREEIEDYQNRTGKSFYSRLKVDDEMSISCLMTELDYISFFKSRHHRVRIEPDLPDKKQTPDFKITAKSHEIYFEIKSITPEREWKKMSEITQEIQSRMRRLDVHYVFLTKLSRGFERSDINAFIEFAKKIFSDLQKKNHIVFPIELTFPHESSPKADLTITKESEKGFSGVISTPAMLLHSSQRLRDRIKSAVKQLPPSHPNVVVIDGSSSTISLDDLEDALEGDLSLRISIYKDPIRYSTKTIRTGERVYGEFNRRVSAVVLYKRKLRGQIFEYRKIVIPNRNAYCQLDDELINELGSS